MDRYLLDYQEMVEHFSLTNSDYEGLVIGEQKIINDFKTKGVVTYGHRFDENPIEELEEPKRSFIKNLNK